MPKKDDDLLFPDEISLKKELDAINNSGSVVERKGDNGKRNKVTPSQYAYFKNENNKRSGYVYVRDERTPDQLDND
ncbi:MAG: hypothetical protein ACRBDI_03470 [Alphaproteobacteria bacterium]